MIIIGIILVLFIFMMVMSIKINTTFSLTKSIILGLTISPFLIFSLVADLINKLSVMGLKIGSLLGGEDIDSILKSYLTKQMSNGSIDVMGVRSKDKPEDDEIQ